MPGAIGTTLHLPTSQGDVREFVICGEHFHRGVVTYTLIEPHTLLAEFNTKD